MNLIVLGMHRSGTSALAGALEACGFFPGEHLLQIDQGNNDTGFFENPAVIHIHDEFLKSHDLDWRYAYKIASDHFTGEAADKAREAIVSLIKTEYLGHEPWCIKDPRMCALFPLWEQALAELGIDYGVILMHRHPAAAAASLTRRDGLEAAHGQLLWCHHVLSAELSTRAVPRALLDYESFLEAPNIELTRLFTELKIDRVVNTNLGVDPGLKHVTTDASNSPELLGSLYEQLKSRDLDDFVRHSAGLVELMTLAPSKLSLETLVDQLTADVHSSSIHIRNIEAKAVKANDELAAMQAKVDALKQEQALARLSLVEENKQLAQSLAVNQNRIAELEAQQARFLSSRFWRITEPMRRGISWSRRLKKVVTRANIHRLAFKPEADIQLDQGRYCIAGPTPQFLLVSDKPYLPEGKVRISLELETDETAMTSILAVNHGVEGHHLEFELPPLNEGVNNFRLLLPTHVNCLRLDLQQTEGVFDLKDAQVHELV